MGARGFRESNRVTFRARNPPELIIATHSPILLAYPHARIYQFSETGIAEVKYTETEHFQITRDFLNRPDRMLELLLAGEDDDLEATKWNL